MSRKIITDTMDKRALIVSFFLFFASAISASDRRTTELSCGGRAYYNVTLAAYYPVFDSDNEFDYLDARTRKLRNLQDYLDGRAEFVTVSMDLDSGIPYGTKLCIPELNEKFLRPIPLQVWSGIKDLTACPRYDTVASYFFRLETKAATTMLARIRPISLTWTFALERSKILTIIR
ncbi:uncharacterized protein LOC126922854 isoform X2 [Bombus affinis]|uniref:uncharacterized protein LOC126922854 isoform X2 n=1 Tax=Bombus affinis TaxID=309941 RepID=UPI0021B83266|nr:uncharacterized protein LOC126922854 isoform X2 [Bombus affinis]